MGIAEDLGVAHVGRERLLQTEGDQPPGRQPQADHTGHHGPQDPPAPPVSGGHGPTASVQHPRQVGIQEQPHHSTYGCEHRRDQMTEQRGGDEYGGQRPMSPGAQTGGHDAEEQQGERKAQGERELTGQRGQEVSPVDREARLEQERQRCRGQTGGPWGTQTGEAAEGPGADGQEQAAEDRDQFERHRVGREDIEEDGDQSREREVEGVERKTVIPTRVPSRQLPMGQQVGLEERRKRDVRPRIAACGGRVQ